MSQFNEERRQEEGEEPVSEASQGHAESEGTPEDAAYSANAPDGPEIDPQPGGYAGRDPKTDMPRVPSAPETQDE